MPNIKYFGYKKYVYAHNRPTKKGAKEYANWLRKKGLLARIVKTKRGYDIYRW